MQKKYFVIVKLFQKNKVIKGLGIPKPAFFWRRGKQGFVKNSAQPKSGG